MKLGKALAATVSGSDRQSVIDTAKEYCQKEGYEMWSNVYREFKLLKWKWIYKIDLVKPIDFEIKRK